MENPESVAENERRTFNPMSLKSLAVPKIFSGPIALKTALFQSFVPSEAFLLRHLMDVVYTTREEFHELFQKIIDGDDAFLGNLAIMVAEFLNSGIRQGDVYLVLQFCALLDEAGWYIAGHSIVAHILATFEAGELGPKLWLQANIAHLRASVSLMKTNEASLIARQLRPMMSRIVSVETTTAMRIAFHFDAARISWMLDDFDAALKEAKVAVALLDQDPHAADVNMKIQVFQLTASCYAMTANDKDLAKFWTQSAADESKVLGTTSLAYAAFASGQGAAYLSMGRPRMSRAAYEKALEVFEKRLGSTVNNVLVATALSGEADAAYLAGSTSAGDCAQKAYGAFESLAMWCSVGALFANSARTFVLAKYMHPLSDKNPMVLEWMKAIIASASTAVRQCYDELADRLDEEDDVNAATAAYDRSFPKLQVARLRDALAVLHMAARRPEAAMTELLFALNMKKDIIGERSVDVADTYFLMGEILRRQYKTVEAKAHYIRSVTIREQLGVDAPVGLGKVYARLTFLYPEEKSYEDNFQQWKNADAVEDDAKLALA